MSKQEKKLAVPTKEQLEWADKEIGVIIHFDLQVFEPGFEFRCNWGYSPDLKVFNPENLDTDKWLETAKSAGAKYAVLVAKHCSGFSLWPTKAHDYHVGNTPWKNGAGDVVGDFFKSCEKYDIKPGLYCSAATNGYMLADNPGKVLTDDPEFLKKYNSSIQMQSGKESIWADEEKQAHYRNVVETQLTELWSNYGKLFEIWFDGGVLPPEQGGPNIVPIMKQLQPDAVVFGGPREWPSLVRFVGNERAEPPEPFWNSTGDLRAFDGTEDVCGLEGNPDGSAWAPGEADMPNRDQNRALQGGWFWREGDDQYLYSIDHLTERYFSSVGRSCNLLLGMVIDNRGMVPEADQKQFADFGKQVNKIFSNPLPSDLETGEDIVLRFLEATQINMVELQEDIQYGERIRKYILEAEMDEKWVPIACGAGIGHKKLDRFEALETSAIRLKILETAGEPKLKKMAAWYADPSLFSVSLDLAKRNPPIIIRNKDGYVKITCNNPNLKIKYTVNGETPDNTSPDFASPILLPEGGTVQAYSYLNEYSQSETVTAVFGGDRSDWDIHSVSFDSPFANNGHASVNYLLNDDPEYYWHTYSTDKTQSPPPHEVVLDMKREIDVKAFTVMSRGFGGTPGDGEFYLSDDGNSWTLAKHAKFADTKQNPEMRLVKLDTPMKGRYLRFKVNNIAGGNDYLALSGIGVIE